MVQGPKLSFREIAQEIRQAIVGGQYPPATLMPPEPVLAERFGVSRALVNRAMQLLAAEGLIQPRQGRGTMVTWLPPLVHSSARYAQDTREKSGARGAFDAEIKALGLEPQHEITTGRERPPAEVAEALGVAADSVSCVVRRRRLSASGIRVRLNASWFPLSIAADTVLEDGGAVIVGGVKSFLAEEGHRQVRATEADLMRSYAHGEGCLMQFLQQALDDPDPHRCGRCSVCTGRLPAPGAQPSQDTVAAARAFFRGQTLDADTPILVPDTGEPPIGGL